MLEFILENSFFLYSLIFIVITLEYANLPLPSEVVLPLAGALSIPFNLNVGIVLAISVLGGVIGCLINYYLGIKYGKVLIDWTTKKIPNSEQSINHAYSFFEKHKKLSVLIGRIVPFVRTTISLVAGVFKMKPLQFTLFSMIGISVWNTALILGGYIFFDNLGAIASALKTYSIFMKLIALCIALYVFFKYRKRQKK